MSEHHRTVTTKMAKERVAQLDRLAERKGFTRSAIIRRAVEELLDESDEPLPPEDAEAIFERQRHYEFAVAFGQWKDARRARHRAGSMWE